MWSVECCIVCVSCWGLGNIELTWLWWELWYVCHFLLIPKAPACRSRNWPQWECGWKIDQKRDLRFSLEKQFSSIVCPFWWAPWCLTYRDLLSQETNYKSWLLGDSVTMLYVNCKKEQQCIRYNAIEIRRRKNVITVLTEKRMCRECVANDRRAERLQPSFIPLQLVLNPGLCNWPGMKGYPQTPPPTPFPLCSVAHIRVFLSVWFVRCQCGSMPNMEQIASAASLPEPPGEPVAPASVPAWRQVHTKPNS